MKVICWKNYLEEKQEEIKRRVKDGRQMKSSNVKEINDGKSWK